MRRPLRLRLPHWYGGEDHVQDGLSFAMAPHTLKKGERVYQFELLKGGCKLSSHCGELDVTAVCLLRCSSKEPSHVTRPYLCRSKNMMKQHAMLP